MQASPVDDDDATTTGARRSGEGLGHVTTGSQLSDLCFVAMGAKLGNVPAAYRFLISLILALIFQKILSADHLDI